ncbi:MAG: hypothetical protein H7Z21_20485 [Hymenobacter sp.]|nr:hypothetical protein [Hymenobacter sp.]
MLEVAQPAPGKRLAPTHSPISRPGTRLLVFCLSLLVFGGCSSGTEEAADPPLATGTPPPAAAKSAPLEVNVFLELSGGMRGFMPTNTTTTRPTAFQQRIGQLASRTNSNPAVGSAQFYLTLQQTPRSLPYAGFRDVVEGDTRQAALGTELPTMLENILALPNAAGKVNVVVSDFIYGSANKATSANMAVRITDALAAVTKQQLAVAVLAETSGFYGSFHPAVKTPRPIIPLTGEARPYYVWVLGPAAAVGRYLNEVLPPADTKPRHAYFGLSFAQVPYAAVLTQVPAASPLAPGGEGSVSYAGAGVSTKLEVSDVEEGVDFTVALNLRQLPAPWQEPAFLARNLQAGLPGGTVALQPNSVKLAESVPGLEAYTHTLRLRLTSLPKAPTTLTLHLPAPGVPAWVVPASTENDNRPGPLTQTYRLAEVMGGLRAAFPAELPAVFTATFSLTQD